ncbi:MAG TPA: DUF4190 domain-containing protein [Minicystis sp.]|nr:DUF4190 domain-containing protein [Minicystis sp.]
MIGEPKWGEPKRTPPVDGVPSHDPAHVERLGREAPARQRGADDDADPPPLQDPYWVAPAPVPAPAASSQLAVTSLLTLLLGPVGSVASIVFGWAARRDAQRTGRRRGAWMANVGIALGVLFTMVWGAVLGFVVLARYRGATPVAEAAESSAPADVARIEPDPGVIDPLPAAPTPAAPLAVKSTSPKKTRLDRVGRIELVDIGASAPVLADELARQRASASKAGETLLVMTTAAKCDPCRGVDKALRDPLLQTALAKVRLVRVDVDVFHDDLEALKVPIKAIPGFFLLAPDLTPRDGINGGEWDDDVAPNIAPVLGAFVRGKYETRREAWQPLPGSGMRL